MANNLLFTIGAKDNSSQVINKVKQNLRFLDQEYKNAQKGTKDFENTQEGLKTKLDMLSNKFEQTKIKLDAYNKKLEETKQKAADQAKKVEELKKSFNMEEAISKSENKLKSYQEKIDKTATAMEKEKKKLEELKKAEGDNTEAISKSEEKISNYQKKIDKLNGNLDKEKTHLENLKAGHADNDAAVAKAEAQLNRYNTQIEKTQQDIRLTEQELKNFSNEAVNTSNKLQNFKLDEMSEKLNKFGDNAKSVGEHVNKFGGNLMKMSSPFVAFAGYATKASIEFESAYKGVEKTVNGTDEQLKQLRDDILEMSERMPESAAEIAGVAEAAGQLGIKTEDITDFTKVMVELGDSTNLSSEEAATSIAKLANITGLSAKDYERFGSAVVDLGNNFATTERDIMEFSSRIAGSGTQIGLTNQDILALSTALSSVGLEAEAGGSAISTVMSQIDKDVATNSDTLQTWASTAGMSVDEFSSLWKNDVMSAIQLVIKGMGDAKEGGENLNILLGELGITNIRTSDTMKRLSNASGLLGKAVETSNKAWNENTALQNEANKRYETTESKIEMCKNQFKKLGIAIGDNLVPHLTTVMEKAEGLVKWFGSLDEGTQNLILKTGLVTFATGGLLKVIGSTTEAVGGLAKSGATLLGWLKNLNSATSTAKAATEGVSSALEVMQGAQVAGAASGAELAGSLGLLGPLLGAVAAGVVSVGAAMYTANEYDKLLNGSILDSTDDMNGFQKVLADVTGIQRYSNKELQEMGLKYKEFSGNIAPETRNTMEGIAEKFRDVQTEISKVNISGMITDEEKQEVVNKVDDLCKTILGRVSELQSEAYSKAKATFEIDGIIDESEQKILDSLDTGGKEITKKVSDIHDQINELNQNGALNTVEGREELQRKLSELQDIYAEEEKAKLEANQQDIDAFRDQANNLDLEKARELLEEKAKIRDEEIEKTKEDYDETLALLKSHVETCSEEERPLYEAKIEELETKRSAELEVENNKYNDWLAMIQEMYPKMAGEINKYNGQMLTDQDKNCQDVLSNLKDTYDGMDKITESGTYTMYDKYSRYWNSVTVKTDDATGEIIGIYDNYNHSIGGYTQEICDDMKEQGNQADITADDVCESFSQMEGATVTASGEIVNADDEVIGSLQDMRNEAGNTRSGIMILNGTPIRVKCDSSGAITNMQNVIRQANAIPNRKEITITTIFKTIGEKVKGVFGYATGTNSAQSGIATVAEEGPELIYNKSRTKSKLVMNPSLVRLEGGEKILNAQDTMKALSGKNINGGFYNSNSLQSKNLVSNTTTNTVTNNTTNNNMDLNGLGDVLTASFIKALNSFNGSGNRLTLDDIAFNTGNNFAKTKRRIRY